MKKLYVGNLAHTTTAPALTTLFERFGPVISCSVIKDKFTDESKGFGFVELESNSLAAEAIKELDGYNLDGRSIKVNEARPMSDRPGGGGGDGRRGPPRSGGRSGGGGGSFRRF